MSTSVQNCYVGDPFPPNDYWTARPAQIVPQTYFWPFDESKDAQIRALEAEIARLHKLIETLARK